MIAAARIDELRRRVEQDPASMLFGLLAEEYRRAGRFDEAVRVARDGLTRHPGYLSVRVTLGKALIDLGRLDEAQVELASVLTSAPENLAAIRALADVHQRRSLATEDVDLPADEFQPAVETLETLDAAAVDVPLLVGEADVPQTTV